MKEEIKEESAVSQKLIVILLVIAILLSLVSTMVSLANFSMESVPQTIPTEKQTASTQGQVSIIINPPPSATTK